jgi:hypothetical protein
MRFFMRVLLKLNRKDLAKVCEINTDFLWKVEGAPSNQRSGKPTYKLAEIIPDRSNQSSLTRSTVDEPRLFLCGNGVMGLMPANGRAGDMIIQFRNSDCAALARVEDHRYRTIGRVFISNPAYEGGTSFHVPLDPDPSPEPWFEKPRRKIHYYGAVSDVDKDVYVNVNTLQLLTQ